MPFGASLAAEPALPAVQRTVVGGAGGWDYLAVDSMRHHLFITRGNRVQVFDTETSKVVDEIAATEGVHGVALALDKNLGLTSNGSSNSITLFDLQSLKTTGRITGVGDGPDAIVYDAYSTRAFTFNGRSRDATAVDVTAQRVVATLPLPGRPESAVVDGRGNLFVDIEDRDAIVRIDTGTLKATAPWPLPGCDGPTGLAIDAAHNRLFVSCANRVLVVVDAVAGAIVARLPIGSGSDAVAFDAQRGLVLSSNRDGTLSIIHEDDADHYSLLPAVPTRVGARTLALDAATHTVYLVTADFEPADAPASGAGRRRPVPVPGTFSVLRVALPR